jgi:hypothetical protein
MALSKLVFKPGINKDQTDYASEGGWYNMDKARFRSGFPEKIGGWTVSTLQPYVGTARSLFAWNTTDGGDPIGIGTNEKMYITVGGNLIDITPIRITYTHSSSPSTDNCFKTTVSIKTVTVTITGHGATEGAWVTFSGATAVGGVPATDLNKEFKIFNVTSNTFQITVATAATSTVAAGGGTAITAAFQINIGNVNTTTGYGWGAGAWGRGSWGSGSSVPIYTQPRLIFQDNFNQDLIFNIEDANIYYWVYNTVSTARAVLLSSLVSAIAVPQQVGKIAFTSEGFLLALGCTTYDATAPSPNYTGYYDPLMIRWSNVDPNVGPEPEVWQPTLTNTAGFLRVQAGSRIITSIGTRQETLIFTDVSLNSLQYLGTAEVFGLQQLSAHISIISPNAVVGANNITYWMGNDKFFTYSGRVDTLPCTLRQYIFQDINRDQSHKFFSGSNVQFNEVIWFYCSATATEIDRYVIYNFSENIWYYGQLNRTAWIDAVINEYPVAASSNWIYFHENGTDDGQPLGAAPLPMTSYIQSADVDISDGDKYMLLRRLIPDVNFGGSESRNPVTGAPITPQAQVTVGVRNFPGAASASTNASGVTTERDVVTATATIDQYTNQVFIRARGRQMNFKIGSDTVGTQWQLGMPRFDARPDGTRN